MVLLDGGIAGELCYGWLCSARGVPPDSLSASALETINFQDFCGNADGRRKSLQNRDDQIPILV
jgi:hypothetical protein